MEEIKNDAVERHDRSDYGENAEQNVTYSAEGRRLRPRKKVVASRSYEEHRSYGSSRSYGDRPQRSYGRSYGDNSYGRSYSDNEHRSYNSDGTHNRSYGDNEHRSYGTGRGYGDRQQRSGYGRSYGDGEHRSYGSDGGERRSYGNGERRSYGTGRSYGDRPQRPSYGRSYGDSERRNYGDGEQQQQRNYNGDSRSYESGERRSYGAERGYGERQQRTDNGGTRRPARSFANGRPKPAPKPKPRKKKKSYQFTEIDEAGVNRMVNRRPQLDASRYSDFDGAAPEIKEEIRLNKFIANSGVCSRREADTYIQAGIVTVNGEVVTELGTKVNVLNDDVRFNGERLKGEEKVYIVMNKPKGYVTTASDPHAEKTVMDLLKGCTARVYPVGRLDKNTTGVLMFTNDGEIAEKLTHPSYDKKKIYQVILDHELSQDDYEKILQGIELSDGTIAADELEYIDENDHRRLGIEIHSGKNRIVRRIFEALGYDVRALDRVYFAGLTKKGVSKGEWRYLTEGEVNILKMGAYL